MRRVLSLLVISLLGCETLSPGLVQVSPRFHSYNIRRVAVLPFEGVPFEKEEVVRPGLRQINYPNNGEIVGDMLMTEMMSIPDFEYVERTQIQRILQEQNLSMTTLIKGKTTSEIGKLLGADAAVLGKVNKFQGAVRYGVGFYWVSF